MATEVAEGRAAVAAEAPTPTTQPPRPHWAARHPRAIDGPPPLVISPSPFRLVSEYEPAGDQPQAIEELVAELLAGERDQVLLGVTGPGRRFTSNTPSPNESPTFRP